MEFLDRIRTTSTTSGTGPKVLDADPARVHLPFTDITDGTLVGYCFAHRINDEFEVGLGTITDNELTRVVYLAGGVDGVSSATAVDFTGGEKDVILCIPAVALAGAQRLKLPAVCVVTTNVTELLPGNTYGGVVVAAGMRVLLTGQTSAQQNGLCEVVAGGALTRTKDMWAGTKACGTSVFITEGTGAGKWYYCTSVPGSDITGSSALTWGTFGNGDVFGPSSSTDNALVRFDSTTGKLIQNSGVTLDDNDKLKHKATYEIVTTVADGATITLNLNLGNTFQTTPTTARNLAFSNVSLNQRWMLRIIQGGSGGNVLTPPASVIWPGDGDPPAPAADAGHADVWGFWCVGTDGYGDPIIYGFVLGLDFPA